MAGVCCVVCDATTVKHVRHTITCISMLIVRKLNRANNLVVTKLLYLSLYSIFLGHCKENLRAMHSVLFSLNIIYIFT